MTIRLPALIFGLCLSAAHAAEPVAPTMGPVIEHYGPVFATPGTTFPLDAQAEWKVLFDVVDGGGNRTTPSRELISLARFLNMHARAGVPVEKMSLAAVIHGRATLDVLDDAAYRARFGVANPNTPLIAALKKAGVRFWLCGQSAAANKVGVDELGDGVGLALSAMTVTAQLQRAGYTLQP
jgi:intracellular sulfur oxidation DsrE/DsrF family protein